MLIFTITLPAVLDGCHANFQGDHSMLIWSLPYTWRVPSGYTVSDVVGHSKVKKYEVRDSDVIKRVCAITEKLSGGPAKGSDIRIVCIICCSDSVADTLSFGGYYMYVNGLQYNLDVSLLRDISGNLATDEREEIERWIIDWKP